MVCILTLQNFIDFLIVIFMHIGSTYIDDIFLGYNRNILVGQNNKI